MLLAFPGIDVNTPHKVFPNTSIFICFLGSHDNSLIQNGYSPLLVAAFDQPAVVKMLLAVPSININFQALEVRIALCLHTCMHERTL